MKVILWDCINFAPKPILRENAKKIISFVSRLEEVENVLMLIPLVLSEK
jgi:hypothetical protein